MDSPRHRSSRRHRRRRGGRAARARVQHRRPLRGRNARRSLAHGRGRVHPDGRVRHVRAARGRARGAGAAALRSDFHRRGLRQRADRPQPRNRRAQAAQPVFGEQGRAPIGWPTATGRRYDVPVIITRASNNYGPNQFPEKVIPLFITNAIDSLPLPLYGDGLNVRDWLHVDDHCRGIDTADRARAERRGLQHRRRQRSPQRRPDATGFCRWRTGRRRSSGRSPTGRATIGATRSTPTSCADSAGRRQCEFEPGWPTPCVVPRQRVVVAADQGTGRGVPGVPPGAVRLAAAGLTPHAAWNDPGHRRHGIRRQPPSRSTRRPRAGHRAGTGPTASRRIRTVTSTGAPSTCSTPPKSARHRGRAARADLPHRRRPAGRVVIQNVGPAPADQRARHAPPARGHSPDRPAVPRARGVLGAGLPGGDEPIDENAPLVPATPYGFSKLAQDQLAERACARRRAGCRDRAAVQPRRPAAGAGVRGVELRQADRADRGGPGAAGAAASATSTRDAT